MSKLIFVFLTISSLLSACVNSSTPQVTVTLPPPTELPIPTPTFHPQFIELQESIAASGGRFSLQADGHIYDGETPVPGVTVSPDGTMTLTVDGETVNIDPAYVSFDDENGITIKGYELDEETGAWVEAISEAMQQTNKLIETYGLADEKAEGKITVTEEGGVVNVTDNEAKKVLIRTTEGRPSEFDKTFAIEKIAKNSCEPKPEWAPNSDGQMLAQNVSEASKYFDEIMAEINYEAMNGMRYLYRLIDPEQRCWGRIISGGDLIYRDTEGAPQRIRLIH